MSNSHFCLEYRLQQKSQTQKILLLALIGSALVHGVLLTTKINPFPRSQPPTKTEEPIELVIVEEPEPEPKSIKPAEPVKTQVIEPPVQSQPIPQPVAPTPPVEPQIEPKIEPPTSPVTTPVVEPQSVLTSPTPSNALVPQVKRPSSTAKPGNVSTTATIAPVAPAKPETPRGGISCLSSCNPEYPFALDGAEGRAAVQLVIGPEGEVISVTLIGGHENSQINRQALLAARNMRFTPTGTTVSVQVTLNFTVAGSQFDRVAKQRQQQLEQERQSQERQQQLQQERQAQERQQQLEQERQQQQNPPEALAPVEPQQPLIPKDAPLLPDIHDRLNK